MTDLAAKCVFTVTVAGTRKDAGKMVAHLQDQIGVAFEEHTIEHGSDGRIVMLVGKNKWSRP